MRFTLLIVVIFLTILPTHQDSRLVISTQRTVSLSPPYLRQGQQKTYSATVPQFSGPNCQVFLVLSGYYFMAHRQFCFDVKITNHNESQVTVVLSAQCDRKIVRCFFYLVGIIPNTFLWMTTIEGFTKDINSSSNNNQLFQLNTPLSIQVSSDFEIVPFISSWKMYGNASYMADLKLAYFDQISSETARIQATKNPQVCVYWFAATIIWVNQTALTNNNYVYFKSQFQIYWFSATDYYLFDDMPDRFGIPGFYSSLNTTLYPRCFIGFTFMQFGGSTYTNNSAWTCARFITSNYPIASYLIRPFLGSTRQQFWSQYHIFCFDESSCQYNQYFNFENQTCQSCTTNYPCISCLNSGCIECDIGMLINGTCWLPSIIGCIQVLQLPGGSAICLACDESKSFRLNTNSGTCDCLDGTTLFNEKCNLIIDGCIAYEETADGTEICLFCNISSLYEDKPNAQDRCVCKTGYQLKNGYCAEICGDGLLMNTSNSACDDGNTVDGDGCSSTCRVEVKYRCENGTDVTASVCVYFGMVGLNLNKTERLECSNSGMFTFLVNPALKNMQRMNLTKYITFECNSTYKITSRTYSEGKIQITVVFTEDLEQRRCNFSLSFDPTIVNRPKIELSFNVESSNMPLVVSNKLSEYQQIKFIFEIIALITLGLFIIGLPRKMLGVELLSCCQITFLSLCLYQRPVFLYTAIKGLSLVTGGWSFFVDESSSSRFSSLTERISISFSFIEMSGIVAGCLAVFTILWAIFMLVKNRNCQEKQAQKVQNETQKKEDNEPEENKKSIQFSSLKAETKISQKGIIIIYNWLIFPVVAGFLFMLLISTFLHSSKFIFSQKSKGFLTLSSLAMLLVSTLIGAILTIQTFGKAPYGGSKYEPSADLLYIPLFLGKIISSSTIFILGFTNLMKSDLSVYSLMTLETLFLLYLIFKRPYQMVIMNIGAICCQVCTVFAIGLPILHRFYALTEETEVLILFGLQGLLVLAQALTLLRILKSYYNSIMISRKIQQNSKNETGKTLVKKENEIIKQTFKEEETNLYEKYRSYLPTFLHQEPHFILNRQKERKQDKILSQEDEEILNKIKEKHREDFYQKKEYKKELLKECL